MSSLLPIPDQLAGAHLVVTGVTGFVGKVWLSHLLAHVPDIGKVTVVVRPNRKATARERFARIVDTSPAFRPVRELAGRDLGRFIDRRVEVVEGDVARPHCGLDRATLDRLAVTADAVVHVAGLTDFHPDPRKGFPANVDGARHAGELAQRLRTPRLLHVSTCYVTGMAEGDVAEHLTPGVSPLGIAFDVHDEIRAAQEVIAEVDRPADRTDVLAQRARALGWPNLYTFTKALAEHLLAQMDLDLTIVRPSVVECARTFPFQGWNEGLNTSGPIMYFCGTAFPVLPATPHHHFDVIPVDAVVRWMTVALAAQLRGEAHPVYQLASSDVNPATFERIVELTALGRRRHAARPGASLKDRLVAHLDAQPRGLDAQPMATPERFERWTRDVRDLLDGIDPAARLPRPLQSRLRDRLRRPLKDTSHRLRKHQRSLGQLKRMLDLYQPFLHDHHWTFLTDHIRGEVARLHPSDREAFGDDVSTMCWRDYWLNVQYPGIVRWAFPLFEGLTVADDPPSSVPLTLGLHAHAWDVPQLNQGVA